MSQSSGNVEIRDVTVADAPAIRKIYNFYIEHTIVTFEEEVVDDAEIERRILEVTKLHPWIVLEDESGEVVGYAYSKQFYPRAAYRHTVETSVYLCESKVGQGFGIRLYRELLKRLKERSIHTAIAVVSLPNDASAALHERLGFKKSGHLSEVGSKFGNWIDVGYWQLSLG